MPTPQVPQVPLPTATPQVPNLPIPTPTPDNPGTPGARRRRRTTPVDRRRRPAAAARPRTRPRPAKGKQKRPGANTETLKRKVRKKEREVARDARRDPSNPGRNLDGTPTLDNPTFSLSTPGAAPIGVPNFFIDKFRIPPFLLSIYQAAGIQYGIRWEILAAINEIETDYGRNLNISSAGALGWMQFMPATWKMYGVDANRDGKKDPYNPVDAIFAAARYLRAAGGDQDIRKAIFAYNHADWYVDSVLLRARVIGGLPSNLVGSLTGLTQGRFPVHVEGHLRRRHLRARHQAAQGQGQQGRRGRVRRRTRRGIKIFSRKGAAGGRRQRRPHHRDRHEQAPRPLRQAPGRLRQHVHVRAPGQGRQALPGAEGAARSPSARSRRSSSCRRRTLPPTVEASGSKAPAARAPKPETAEKAAPRVTEKADRAEAQAPAGKAGKERLFANPRRKNAADAGGAQQEFERTGRIDGVATFQGYLSRVFGLDRSDVRLKTAQEGLAASSPARSSAGSARRRRAPRRTRCSRSGPAGRGAPRIDPKPILDGWKLLESTAIYRAAGKNPFFGSDVRRPVDRPDPADEQGVADRARASTTRGSSSTAAAAATSRPGQIDRRVLATLEFLAASGFKPTVTSLKCGHSLHDGVRQRVRALHRATRSTSRPSTASRSSATRARARSPS